MRILFVLFVCALCSCGAQHKLHKAERLINQAVAMGAEVKNDTIYKYVRFVVPGTSFNTTLIAPNFLDTAYIKGKDSVFIKIVRIPAKGKEPEKIYIQAKCPDKNVVERVPVIIEREIKAGYSLWQMIVLAIACLAFGHFVVGPLIKTAINIFRKFFPV